MPLHYSTGESSLHIVFKACVIFCNVTIQTLTTSDDDDLYLYTASHFSRLQNSFKLTILLLQITFWLSQRSKMCIHVSWSIW